ncbi:MAG: hypothetical protein HUU16_20750 [Candidatus Omnitrophica bacterium]|nr:hypothetical protein [Candidatus Omnitrophota bacterium]
MAPFLGEKGCQVFTVPVHPSHTIEHRAGEIERFVESHPALSSSPLNLIAHSMGGLEARLLARRWGPDKVRSVTTLATPHRGSFLADLLDAPPGIRSLIRWAAPGIRDLTRREMERFNEANPDVPGIHYLSIVAEASFRTRSVPLWPFYLILRVHSGPNDGQVSADSQEWGEVLERVASDHVQLIGMRVGVLPSGRFDHLALYGRIVEELARRGC